MKEFRIPLSWGSVAAVARGPEDGTPFLLLHGWLDNSASFEPMTPFFPKSWRTVALDLPGHGHSDHRPTGTVYHLSDTILDLVRVADRLGWKKFSMISHSLGGAIASMLAGAFPERVDKLILLEALGPLSSPESENPTRLAELYSAENSLTTKKLPIYPEAETAVRARIQAGGISAEAARLLTLRSLKKTEGGFTWASDRRLRLPTQRFSEEQVMAFLREIQCPTLGVFSEHGLVFRQPSWEKRAKAIGPLTTVRVPGGHHMHMEAPQETAKIVVDWAKS